VWWEPALRNAAVSSTHCSNIPTYSGKVAKHLLNDLATNRGYIQLFFYFLYLSFSLYFSGRVNVLSPNMTTPLPELIQMLAGISSGKEFLRHTQNNKKTLLAKKKSTIETTKWPAW
jgi:hypothetical protein